MENTPITKKVPTWLYATGGILIILIVALVIYLSTGDDNTDTTPSTTYNNTPQNVVYTQNPTNSTNGTGSGTTADITWSFNDQEWVPSATPPSCPEPLTLETPVTLSDVRSILYPGQTRGGNYKPHGGFLFSLPNNKTTITAPMDAVAVEGSRYIEQGETQYLIFFVNSCGIAYRFDHLKTLSPAMMSLMETLPAPKTDDSRTTRFNNPITVKKGDVIATAVGFEKNNNVSVDLGVYDLREANKASQNASYASKYQNVASQAFYAVCWFDMLAPADSAKIKALPGADATSGKKSDYCN